MLAADLILFGAAGLAVWAVQMMWIPFFAAGAAAGQTALAVVHTGLQAVLAAAGEGQRQKEPALQLQVSVRPLSDFQEDALPCGQVVVALVGQNALEVAHPGGQTLLVGRSLPGMQSVKRGLGAGQIAAAHRIEEG
jgi:hypothetical protein